MTIEEAEKLVREVHPSAYCLEPAVEGGFYLIISDPPATTGIPIGSSAESSSDAWLRAAKHIMGDTQELQM